MIIFDLDGTLANCEHRRHFVDRSKVIDLRNCDNKCGTTNAKPGCNCSWKPNWPAFYEACDRDEPIKPVIEIFQSLIFENPIRLRKEIQIWSGRCESVREKTQACLDKHVWGSPSVTLKMRPIGDNTPDDVLKERWLDEALAQGKTIDFVFDSDCGCEMWNRRGIMVFKVIPGDKHVKKIDQR